MSNLENWGIDELIKKGGVMVLNPKDIVMTDKQKLKEIQKVIDKYNDNDYLPADQCLMEIEIILKHR